MKNIVRKRKWQRFRTSFYMQTPLISFRINNRDDYINKWINKHNDIKETGADNTKNYFDKKYLNEDRKN